MYCEKETTFILAKKRKEVDFWHGNMYNFVSRFSEEGRYNGKRNQRTSKGFDTKDQFGNIRG